MKREGTTIIELLFAISIITIGFFAVIRAVVTAGKESSLLTHTNEARQIAKIHIDHDEALAKKHFDQIKDKSWEFENSKSYYATFNLKLTKKYFVKEDVSYVVFDQTINPAADEAYKVRPMIDLDNDGADDYTGQGKDLKQVIITVTWPEKTAPLTYTAIINVLLSNDTTFKKKYRVRTFKMSSVISSFEPMDKSCCDNPSVSNIEVLTTDNKSINIKTTPLDVSTSYKIRIGLNDQCVSKLPTVEFLYWYYGEDVSNAKSIPMKYAGNLNYYIVTIPGSEIKNADTASEKTGEYTCSESMGYVEPYDMYFEVHAKDDYIGEKCAAGTVRESYSDSLPINVEDTESPIILDYTSRIVSKDCLGLIIAKILDGSNGLSGLASETAYWAKMDANGNIGALQEITNKSGPDSQGNFFWTLPQSALTNWSGGEIFDDKPDIFYKVKAEDTCGNTVATPADLGIAKPTTVTITDTDVNPPMIYLDYDGLGFEDCVPYGERKIPISFFAVDECELNTIGFSIISKDTDATTNTWVFDVSGNNYYTLNYDLYPPSRNDIKFWAFANDSAKLTNWVPPEDKPNIIHQSNAIYYNDPTADPYVSGDVALQGGYNDTVAISLTDYRNGDIYLYSLNIDDPTYKSVCLSTGDTSAAFPYIDSVVLETQASDGSDYKHNLIWDWKNGEPNPGSRKRAPIEIFFDQTDPDKLLVKGYGTKAILYLHFMDRPTDDPFPAQPFAMDEMDYNLTVNADPTRDYKCNTHLEFSTKTTDYDYPPVANAGEDNFGTVDSPIYFEGRASNDCDNTRDQLTYYWDFGDGNNSYGATAWHTYDETFYKQEKAEQSPSDNEPVHINVILTVTDPGNESDTDLCKIDLHPKSTSGTNTNTAPTIDSFTCSSVSSDSLTLKFDVTVTDPDDSTLHYSFDWDDGSADTYNDDNTLTETHTYAKNTTANFTVAVTVSDSAGNTATATTGVGCSGKGANSECTCQ